MSTERKKTTWSRLKDLTPALADKEVSIKVIVLEGWNKSDEPTNGGSSPVTILVADETASISLLLGKPVAAHIRPGDILQIAQCQVTMRGNHLYLSGGRVERTGDFLMLFKDAPHLTGLTWTKDPNNPQSYIANRTAAKRPSKTKA